MNGADWGSFLKGMTGGVGVAQSFKEGKKQDDTQLAQKAAATGIPNALGMSTTGTENQQTGGMGLPTSFQSYAKQGATPAPVETAKVSESVSPWATLASFFTGGSNG